MTRIWFGFLMILISGVSFAQNHTYVSIETNHGTMIVQLANETPAHRDNFIRLVRSHFFDKTFFHRVVPRFVIQGGDPDSILSTPADTNRLKAERIMPEFPPNLFHKRGALGMGSDDNIFKASFFTQFYIVVGRTYTDAEMDSVEKKRLQGRRISNERRAVYKTMGGTPQLDGNYTIFGEVVRGFDVVDHIANTAAVKTIPVEPIWMKLKLLKKRKARKLERDRQSRQNE